MSKMLSKPKLVGFLGIIALIVFLGSWPFLALRTERIRTRAWIQVSSPETQFFVTFPRGDYLLTISEDPNDYSNSGNTSGMLKLNHKDWGIVIKRGEQTIIDRTNSIVIRFSILDSTFLPTRISISNKQTNSDPVFICIRGTF